MVPEVVSCLGQNAPFPVAAARLFSAGTASTHLESCNGLPTAERLYRSLGYSLTGGPRNGSPAWCIIAAVAAPADVIRMLAPRRGVVPTSAAPVLFWLGAALCDFSEAVTGCGASSVAAVVVGAVAMVVASIGVACAELDGGAESCRLSGALTAGGAGEMIVESAAPGLRGIALTDLPSTLGSWPHARAHGAVACSCCQGIEADLSAGVAGLQRG